MSANPIERMALLSIFTSPAGGLRSVADMPRRGPVRQALLGLVVPRLAEAGLVEHAAGRLRPTALGWARAGELTRVDG